MGRAHSQFFVRGSTFLAHSVSASLSDVTLVLPAPCELLPLILAERQPGRPHCRAGGRRGTAGQGVAAASVAAGGGAGLVEAAPGVVGQDDLYGVVGVEAGGSEAVPDALPGGRQQWPGANMPVLDLT